MNFHFVFGFVKDARGCAEIGADVLTAVAEEDVTGEALFARFQRTHGTLCEEIHSNSFSSARVANHTR